MVPKMHPRSSKMLPRRPTGFRGNNFFHPWGSKVTSWVPKVSPGVPKWALQALPRPQKKNLLDIKVSLGGLLPLLRAVFVVPLVCSSVSCCPLAPSTQRPIGASTLQAIDATSL